MGCTNTKQKNLLPMKQSHTINGLLKVTILEANISKNTSQIFDKMFGMDPYLKLRLSNQQFKGYIHKKANRDPLFNESFQFVINSCYKANGRSLEIQVWDERSINDKLIGMCAIDIDPIINLSQKNVLSVNRDNNRTLQNQIQPQILNEKENLQYRNEHQSSQGQDKNYLRRNQCKMKIFLSNDCQKTGFLNTQFQFYQQPVQTIGFRFIYANLRQKSALFTTRNVWIQVVAGQQILATHKQKNNTAKNPPSWQDQILICNIPTCLKHCLIRVMSDKDEIGKMKIPIVQLLDKKGEHHFTEEIQHGQTVTGVIKFTVSIGMKSVIEQMKKQSNIKIQTQAVPQQINQTRSPKMQRQVLKQVTNTVTDKPSQLLNKPQQNRPFHQQISTSQSIHQQSQLQKQRNYQFQDKIEQNPKNLKTQQSMAPTTIHYSHGNQQQISNPQSKVHTINSSRLVMDRSNNYGY